MSIPIYRRQFLVNVGAGVWGLARVKRSERPQARRPSDLDNKIFELREQTRVMGAGVGVVQAGNRIETHSVGMKNWAAREAVSEETVFEAASLSKPVFAYAVMTLVAEGKLDLNRPLTDYVPQPFRSRRPDLMASEVPDDSRLKRITPRMVLDHTTGFPNWARKKPLTFLADPGEKFGYSGEGYVYLQNVVESVSDQSLDQFARKRVFAPLGMDSSSFVWRDDYETRAAIGYTRRGPEEKTKPRVPLAAASLHCTAGDFAKFLGAVLFPEKTQGGLNAKWINLMLTQQSRIDDSLGWGLGWGLEHSSGGDCFWQWGDNGEFKAFAMGCREAQRGAVVLTNSGNGLNLCRAIIEYVLPGAHPAFSFGMLDY